MREFLVTATIDRTNAKIPIRIEAKTQRTQFIKRLRNIIQIMGMTLPTLTVMRCYTVKYQ